jgi:hypothetical protein
MTRSRHILAPRVRWTKAEREQLRREYPHRITALIAHDLRRKLGSVYQQAAKLRLKKSAAFYLLPASGRLLKSDTRGTPTRFKPGQIPPNKGVRRPGWGPGRMKETQFKKGRRATQAHNYLPLGALRITKDGLLERKVTDNPKLVPARRWEFVHRQVWVRHRGKIPRGHVIRFKSGRRTAILKDITIGRLECVSFADNCRRNSLWTVYPKPLARLIQLRGALNRRIREEESRAQNHE